MRRSIPLAVVAAALLLGACSGGSGDGRTPTSPLTTNKAAVEFDSFTQLNAAREENEVEPQLDLRERVAEVARRHSENMRDSDFMAHTDPAGKTVADRLIAAGIQFRSASENLAHVEHAGNPAAYAHRLLMESEPHRHNILNGRFELVGVGVARRGDDYWFTQVFIER